MVFKPIDQILAVVENSFLVLLAIKMNQSKIIGVENGLLNFPNNTAETVEFVVHDVFINFY